MPFVFSELQFSFILLTSLKLRKARRPWLIDGLRYIDKIPTTLYNLLSIPVSLPMWVQVPQHFATM